MCTQKIREFESRIYHSLQTNDSLIGDQDVVCVGGAAVAQLDEPEARAQRVSRKETAELVLYLDEPEARARYRHKTRRLERMYVWELTSACVT